MNQSSPQVTRRGLLKSAAAASTAFAIPQIVPRHCVAGSDLLPPSETVNVAGIGIGGMAGNDIRASHYAGARIAALCDVDTGERRAPERHGAAADSILVRPIAADDFPDAPRYRDFRVLLDEAADIDAVIVGTPDHTHATIAMAAIHSGKHVYCEKPLARTVYEIRKLTEAAREHGVATQLGNQGHSFLACREFCEAIWSDAIGDVTEVHAVVSFGGGDPNSRIAQLQQQHDVPDTLDWNLWLGPAPTRDFHPTYHPGGWRGWRHFGSGILGDFLCHLVDPVFWALRLDAPTSILAEADGYNPERHGDVFPRSSKIRYEFPARGSRRPVTLNWYDGDLYRPPAADHFTEGRYELPIPGREGGPGLGVLVVGEKGHIVYESHGARNWRIYPETRMDEYMDERPRLDRPGVRSTGLLNYNHHRDWLHACKGYEPAGSNFDYGGPLTGTCRPRKHRHVNAGHRTGLGRRANVFSESSRSQPASSLSISRRLGTLTPPLGTLTSPVQPLFIEAIACGV